MKELESKKGLSINWFGGEPLLKTELLKKLSLKFMDMCNKKNCTYKASITTNGYLLSSKNITLLKEINVDDIQVTLDGPPDIHNLRRPLTNGAGTFETILNNLNKAAGEFKTIRVRVNVDKKTIERVDELLEILEPLKEVIYIGFYPVSFPGGCYDETNCLKGSEFSGLNLALLQKAYERGFRIVSGFVSTGLVYCGAYQLDTLIVSPDGNIYKCVVDIGKEERKIGYLGENGIEYIYPKMLPWAAYEPFDEEECRNCKVLPACMGGCLKFLEKKDNESKEKRCAFKREIIARFLLSSMVINNEE